MLTEDMEIGSDRDICVKAKKCQHEGDKKVSDETMNPKHGEIRRIKQSNSCCVDDPLKNVEADNIAIKDKRANIIAMSQKSLKKVRISKYLLL